MFLLTISVGRLCSVQSVLEFNAIKKNLRIMSDIERVFWTVLFRMASRVFKFFTPSDSSLVRNWFVCFSLFLILFLSLSLSFKLIGPSYSLFPSLLPNPGTAHGSFINHLSHRGKSGWKASQTNFTTGVRGSLHTNQFLTRLESLGVKNSNTREAIRNRTVQKTLSMSDMILKFFFIALNSKTDWTLQNLPTEIVNKNMERFNLHLLPPRS